MPKTYERTKLRQSQPFLRLGEIPIEFESVCRLCLKSHEQMYDIFKDDFIVPIFVKIKTLVNLKVSYTT